MSRNCCSTDCAICEGRVEITGEFRLISENEAGSYYKEFSDVYIAPARCVWCGALYWAWKNYPNMAPRSDVEFVDLSFRSTFDDEPGELDLPDRERVLKAVVEEGEAHDRITFVNRGAFAGQCIVAKGDGDLILERMGDEGERDG